MRPNNGPSVRPDPAETPAVICPRLTPIAVLVCLAGCSEAPTATTYVAPKESVKAGGTTAPETGAPKGGAGPAMGGMGMGSPPSAGSVAAKPGEPARTLAAMIPVGDKYAYFAKLTGPEALVEKNAAAFKAFVATIRVGATPEEKPTYGEAPAGWRKQPDRQFRVVTFQVGEPGAALDAVVNGPFAGSVLDNVNRWRNEVSLPPLQQGELAANVTPLALGPVQATYVDLRGTASGGGMGAPGKGPFQK